MLLSIGNGGWVRYEDAELDPSVFVRFADRDGRLVPIDMFLPAMDGLDAGLLRKVPLGVLQAWVNEPDIASDVRAHLAIAGPDLRTAASHFATNFGGKVDHWVARMLRAQHESAPKSERVTPGPLSEFGWDRRRRQKAGATHEPVEIDARLDVPPGRPYPDGFYKEVARVYSSLASTRRAPAVAIADANPGVAITSVHRWVRECRERGLLSPGRKGKAG